MKKLFALLFVIVALQSCSVDDGQNFYFEILPVEGVVLPDEFVVGQAEQIVITYIRPTACHTFNDFYYVPEENQRTIAVVNTVVTGDCPAGLNQEVEVSFNFLPLESFDSYVFRFWQGEDDNGEDTYYIVEIPVVPN
ncbi:hypothetical protein [Winogradskyella sp. 3972H.M.0a.05]|uniref:hypothetical protein n=1 Tax=Winogradskyella sp. 3972H.M.0a.05 TaxID=2950277 RepID=UPI00339970D4